MYPHLSLYFIKLCGAAVFLCNSDHIAAPKTSAAESEAIMNTCFLDMEMAFKFGLNGLLKTLNQRHDQCGQVTDIEGA